MRSRLGSSDCPSALPYMDTAWADDFSWAMLGLAGRLRFRVILPIV